MPASPVAHVLVAVRVGGRHEPDAYAGISHFLEHMIFSERTEPTTLTELRKAGALINGSTDFELTRYHATVRPDQAGQALDALAQMVLSPRLDEQAVEACGAVDRVQVGEGEAVRELESGDGIR